MNYIAPKGDKVGGISLVGRGLMRFCPSRLSVWLAGLNIVAAATILSSAAAAPSFDCKTSKHPNEKLVCQSAELSELDNRMAALYSDLINYLNRGDQDELKQSQQRWLRERLNCDDNFTCTKQAYTRRIERLSIVLARVGGPRAPSESAYSVAGLALGARVQSDSREYRNYACNPSDQFTKFICVTTKKQSMSGAGRSKPLIASYIRTMEPLFYYSLAGARLLGPQRSQRGHRLVFQKSGKPTQSLQRTFATGAPRDNHRHLGCGQFDAYR